MKKLQFLTVLCCLPFFLFAQDAEKPKYRMLEDVLIVVKPGENEAFEAAVKAHNEKYHKEGTYEATLYRIATGKDVGTYVWEMGPLTFSDMGGRPMEADGHDADWDANVATHIKKVTSVEYWRYNNKLSYWKEGTDYSNYEIWYFDIKQGKWDTWSAFMEKVKKINEKMGDSFSVWNNRYSQNDGRQISMSFGFNDWADLDKDDWNMAEEFDKEYGEGAWDKALMDWSDSTTPVSREVWVEVK